MKKILLLIVACISIASTTFAKATQSEVESNASRNIPGIPLLDNELASSLRLEDVKATSQFIIRGIPGLTQEDSQLVEAYLVYNIASAQADADLGGNEQTLINWLRQQFKNSVNLISLINKFSQQVLPLYNYLMDGRSIPQMDDVSAYTVDTAYAAPVDELFYGIGDERNNYNPLGFSKEEINAAKANGARVKHNQAYLWGMVTVGDKVYFSTNTNFLCQGAGSIAVPGQDVSNGYEIKDCWACEMASGKFGRDVHAKIDPSYASLSDSRYARMYCYDTKTGMTEDISPSGKDAAGNDYELMALNCQGLRSAGAHNGVVFFGGPALYGSGYSDGEDMVGSSFFAYDADAEKFIGCSDMKNIEGMEGYQVTNVRRWLVYNNVLYVGVRITDANGTDRGAVLRWYGNKTNPWKFKVVGLMKNEAAEIEVFNNHMYVSGWNTASLKHATLIKGPKIPVDGMQPVDINSPEWDIVWDYTSYDKNSVNWSTVYGGALKQWNGKLYWGTISIAYTLPVMAQSLGYTDFSTPEAMAFFLGALRPTTFWRIDEKDRVDMLYGETMMPIWNKMTKFDQYGRPAGPDTWSLVPTGWYPIYGRSGFGKPLTNYTWALEEYKGDLYIGTMNFDNLVGGVAGNYGDDSSEGSIFKAMQSLLGIEPSSYGFELLKMDNHYKAPKYITANGFGNGSAYGIRNFATCGDDLYIGTAAPLNLRENGGWHLFRMNSAGSISGITETTTQNCSLIFKRNADNIVFATSDGSDIQNIAIYDINGRVLAEKKVASHIAEIPTSGINANLMIVKVKTANGTFAKEIKK